MSINVEEDVDGWYVVVCEFLRGREALRSRFGPYDEERYAKQWATGLEVIRHVKMAAFGTSCAK